MLRTALSSFAGRRQSIQGHHCAAHPEVSQYTDIAPRTGNLITDTYFRCCPTRREGSRDVIGLGFRLGFGLGFRLGLGQLLWPWRVKEQKGGNRVGFCDVTTVIFDQL